MKVIRCPLASGCPRSPVSNNLSFPEILGLRRAAAPVGEDGVVMRAEFRGDADVGRGFPTATCGSSAARIYRLGGQRCARCRTRWILTKSAPTA